MKYSNLIIKTVSLLLILGALWQYQTIAKSRAEIIEENKAAVEEAESYNEQILIASGEIQVAVSYSDGSYEGVGAGFGGDIKVSVIVKNGDISEIIVLSASGEDTAYYSQAESVLDEIIASQNTQVDTVSGATFSSRGLIEVVEDALTKAVKE